MKKITILLLSATSILFTGSAFAKQIKEKPPIIIQEGDKI